MVPKYSLLGGRAAPPKTPKGVRRYLSVRQVTMRIFSSDSLLANGQKKSPVFQRCSSINLTVCGQFSPPKILCNTLVFCMGFLKEKRSCCSLENDQQDNKSSKMNRSISYSETSFILELSGIKKTLNKNFMISG